MTPQEREELRQIVADVVVAALKAQLTPRRVAGLLTLEEAGDRICTAPETIRHWVWEGRLKAYKPGRAVLVKESDLLELVAANETRAKRVAKRKKQMLGE
jgi:excisionase family DNA binding protein